jgi:hypothetical protein
MGEGKSEDTIGERKKQYPIQDKEHKARNADVTPYKTEKPTFRSEVLLLTLSARRHSKQFFVSASNHHLPDCSLSHITVLNQCATGFPALLLLVAENTPFTDHLC